MYSHQDITAPQSAAVEVAELHSWLEQYAPEHETGSLHLCSAMSRRRRPRPGSKNRRTPSLPPVNASRMKQPVIANIGGRSSRGHQYAPKEDHSRPPSIPHPHPPSSRASSRVSNSSRLSTRFYSRRVPSVASSAPSFDNEVAQINRSPVPPSPASFAYPSPTPAVEKPVLNIPSRAEVEEFTGPNPSRGPAYEARDDVPWRKRVQVQVTSRTQRLDERRELWLARQRVKAQEAEIAMLEASIADRDNQGKPIKRTGGMRNGLPPRPEVGGHRGSLAKIKIVRQRLEEAGDDAILSKLDQIIAGQQGFCPPRRRIYKNHSIWRRLLPSRDAQEWTRQKAGYGRGLMIPNLCAQKTSPILHNRDSDPRPSFK